VHHEYSDKYILSEFLAVSAIATFLNSFEYLGLTGKNWDQVKGKGERKRDRNTILVEIKENENKHNGNLTLFNH